MSKAVCIDCDAGHHAARRLARSGIRKALHRTVAKGSSEAGCGSGLVLKDNDKGALAELVGPLVAEPLIACHGTDGAVCEFDFAGQLVVTDRRHRS